MQQTGPNWTNMDACASPRNTPNNHGLVYVCEGKERGYALAEKSNGIVYIASIAVCEQRRREGIATKQGESDPDARSEPEGRVIPPLCDI